MKRLKREMKRWKREEDATEDVLRIYSITHCLARPRLPTLPELALLNELLVDFWLAFDCWRVSSVMPYKCVDADEGART